MSDLIVIGYPDEATADKVWNELVRQEKDSLADLEDAAIIRRDREDRLHVTTLAHHAVAWGSLSGTFWGVVIGLLFMYPLPALVGTAKGMVGAALHAAADLGIGDDFRRRVQDVAKPGTSAILAIVRRDIPDKFLEALQPYDGTVLRACLTRDVEQELMKTLHGEDLTAASWRH